VRRLIGLFMLGLGGLSVATAGVAAIAPEIDPAGVISAVALLGGGLLVLRARRKS